MYKYQEDLIKQMLTVPAKERKALRKLAQKHSEAQANGYYWYNDDDGVFEGEQAKLGARREAKIFTDLTKLFGGTIPSFVTYSGDCRGFVLKIEANDLTDIAREYCEEVGLHRDWGGDYTILTSEEVQKLGW